MSNVPNTEEGETCRGPSTRGVETANTHTILAYEDKCPQPCLGFCLYSKRRTETLSMGQTWRWSFLNATWTQF